MPRVPMEDSLIGPPVVLVRQIRREGTRGSDQNLNCSLSDCLVTDLELDGNDLGPMIKYTKEILFDDTEKQFDRRGVSISDRTRVSLPRVSLQRASLPRVSLQTRCHVSFLVM